MGLGLVVLAKGALEAKGPVIERSVDTQNGNVATISVTKNLVVADESWVKAKESDEATILVTENSVVGDEVDNIMDIMSGGSVMAKVVTTFEAPWGDKRHPSRRWHGRRLRRGLKLDDDFLEMVPNSRFTGLNVQLTNRTLTL
jgi:hypothetical protein